MQKNYFATAFLLLFMPLLAMAQQYEYWLDKDYNHRTTRSIGLDGESFEVDVSQLQPGIHYLNLCAFEGSDRGAISRSVFYIADVQESESPVCTEYWMDSDYVHRMSSTSNTEFLSLSLDLSELQPGIHFFNVRSQGQSGTWGAVSRSMFYMFDQQMQDATVLTEYWFDNGYDNRQIDNSGTNALTISEDISSLQPGIHYLNVRAQGQSGHWGPVNRHMFYLYEEPRNEDVTSISYWIDNDKESTHTVELDNGQAAIVINTDLLTTGEHRLCMQGIGANGATGLLSAVEFKVGMEDILPWGTEEPWESKYVENSNRDNYTEPSTDVNGKGWTELGFDDSAWQTITGPIANNTDVIDPVNFNWSDDVGGLNLRRTFSMDSVPNGKYQLLMKHDDAVKVYLNNQLVIESYDCGTDFVYDIPSTALQVGENIIAIYIDQFGGNNYLDYCLQYLYQQTEPEPYAVLSENNTILTFYYDNQKAERNGMSVGPFYSMESRGWYEHADEITSVIFDSSFAANTTLTSTEWWFTKMTNLTSISGLENLNTQNVTGMFCMFWDCANLTTLDLSHFNTAKVTNFQRMFQGCFNLEVLDLSNFNTTSAMDMSYMFLSCSSLTTIDLGSFNTSNVTDMLEMFKECSNLKTIYVGDKWSTSNVVSGENMFEGCTALVGGAGIFYDASHTNYTYAHIDGGVNNPGYFTQSGTEPYVGPKEQVATPKIQFEDEKILLTSETENATIYYAIKPFDNAWDNDSINRLADELVVNDSSTIYQDPIYANEDFIIKAMAAKEGMENSEIATYIYPYTEWQNLIATTYTVIARIENAIRDYTPSDQLKANIDQLMVEINYVHEVYNHKRTEWERDRIIAERNSLEAYCSNLEIQIAVEKTENNAATYENLVLTVKGQTTMAKALEQVGGRDVVVNDIAAIVWNSTEPITRSDFEGFGNPNLLIYVQTESLAPEGVNNVVIDGKAKNIVLVDAEGNNNFYAPQEFTAESISYTREFKQTTQKDVSRGWEGICLPFTVQTYTHEGHGAIAPFRNNASDYHFWLRQMTDKGLTTAENIEANMPYIISMPNSDAYPEAYNQAGKVTFAAENAKISKSTAVGIQLADRPIIVSGTYHSIATGYYALNVGHEYEGNPEGSIFVLNYREIRPFEVFTWHNGSGARSISISSLFGGEGTTDIIDVIAEPNGDRWYDMNGRRLQSKPVRKGIYIKNGKKVVVK